MMTRPACGPLAKREDYIRTAVLYSQLLQPPRVLGNICWVFHDNLREKRSQFPEFPYFPVFVPSLSWQMTVFTHEGGKLSRMIIVLFAAPLCFLSALRASSHHCRNQLQK